MQGVAGRGGGNGRSTTRTNPKTDTTDGNPLGGLGGRDGLVRHDTAFGHRMGQGGNRVGPAGA